MPGPSPSDGSTQRRGLRPPARLEGARPPSSATRETHLGQKQCRRRCRGIQPGSGRSPDSVPDAPVFSRIGALRGHFRKGFGHSRARSVLAPSATSRHHAMHLRPLLQYQAQLSVPPPSMAAAHHTVCEQLLPLPHRSLSRAALGPHVAVGYPCPAPVLWLEAARARSSARMVDHLRLQSAQLDAARAQHGLLADLARARPLRGGERMWAAPAFVDIPLDCTPAAASQWAPHAEKIAARRRARPRRPPAIRPVHRAVAHALLPAPRALGQALDPDRMRDPVPFEVIAMLALPLSENIPSCSCSSSRHMRDPARRCSSIVPTSLLRRASPDRRFRWRSQ